MLTLMEPRDSLYRKLHGDLLAHADASKTTVLAQVAVSTIQPTEQVNSM